MEYSESQVTFARKRAALDVQVTMNGVLMGLDSAANKEIYLPVTAGRYFLIGRDYPDQTDHNDFDVQ